MAALQFDWDNSGKKPPRDAEEYFNSDRAIPEFSEMEKIFTGSLYEAEIIKGLLETNGIEAFIDGEKLASSVGLPVEPGAGLEFVNVLVREKDYDRACEAVEEADLVTDEELTRAAEGEFFDDKSEDDDDEEEGEEDYYEEEE